MGLMEFPARWAPQLRSILRIIVGLMFMLHGTQKLLGFPDPGAKINPNAPLYLKAAGIIEIVGGALIAVGLLTSIAAFIASGEMAVAYFLFHAPQSFYPIVNGGDAAILYCFLFLYLFFAGPGSFSLDAALRGRGDLRASA